MPGSAAVAPTEVLVVGGGIAALETVLALHALAPGHTRVTLLAPDDRFELRPLALARPFLPFRSTPVQLPELMERLGGRFVSGALSALQASERTVELQDGTTLGFDVLVLALGARPVAALPHVTTIGSDAGALDAVLGDIEAGTVRSVAFVVPRGCTWPLPLYELALLMAERVRSRHVRHVGLHLFTPEARPLALFGVGPSFAVGTALADVGVTVHRGVSVTSGGRGRIDTGFGPEQHFDRVLALPLLTAPTIPGVPAAPSGFVPVDDHGRVDGLDDVYAVGDLTDRLVKQGGLACQQADAAAARIAADAGADVEVPPLEQTIRGRLLTARGEHFLARGAAEPAGDCSAEPLWWPPAKVAGAHLWPFLEQTGAIVLPPRTTGAPQGELVHLTLRREQWQPPTFVRP